MLEREISFDTETTGLNPLDGHRIVEIGCVEMVNRIPTGEVFHVYINPERDMPPGAEAVHGLSEAFLADKPRFVDIADAFLDFVKDARLVIHNAEFDMRFINAELTHVKRKNIPDSQVFCTLKEARKRFPGAPASLDALCKRFQIDNSSRTKHGALLDAELLADMYLELMGGSQVTLALNSGTENTGKKFQKNQDITNLNREIKEARPHQIDGAEATRHRAFLEKIPNTIWSLDQK